RQREQHLTDTVSRCQDEVVQPTGTGEGVHLQPGVVSPPETGVVQPKEGIGKALSWIDTPPAVVRVVPLNEDHWTELLQRLPPAHQRQILMPLNVNLEHVQPVPVQLRGLVVER